jgi:large subunit ribosomal protein L16
MLQPKRVKYRNMHRGHRRGKATTGNSVDFGDYGLKALATDWITARQIEAARIAMTHHLRRGGNVWVRIFSDRSVSKKTSRDPNGKRKGTGGPLGGGGQAWPDFV